MTDKPKRPRDANQLAALIVAALIVGVATGDVDDTPPEKAEGQRKGGLKGGKGTQRNCQEGGKGAVG